MLPRATYLKAFLTLGVFSALSVYVIWAQIENDHQTTVGRIKSESKLLASQLAGQFSEIDTILNINGSRYLYRKKQGDASVKIFAKQLANEAQLGPLFSRLVIANADGNEIINTADTSEKHNLPNIADRDFFIRAKAGESGLLFQGPSRAKLDGVWSLLVARRMVDDAGQFAGVIVAVIPVSAFDQSLAALKMSEHGFVSLRTADLKQISHLQASGDVAKEVGDETVPDNIKAVLLATPDIENFNQVTESNVDGRSRFVAAHRVGDYPFYVFVGSTGYNPYYSKATSVFILVIINILLGYLLIQNARKVAVSLETLNKAVREKTLALDEAKRKAEIANEAKSSFLATMSHEIQTPLNAIVGTTYLLEQSNLNVDQKRDVETISASSKNLLALLNDILDFSKIEVGELDLDTRPFSVVEIVRSLNAQFASLAEEKHLRLSFEYNPNTLPPRLLGDGGRLKQILINLLNNAIKFTEQGQVVLSTSVCGNNSPRIARLCFKVSDTGVGIAEEAKAGLFHPFKQADSTTNRKYGGTGLGLSIVQRLVTLMGGEVRFTSELGKGSVFEVILPFELAAENYPEPLINRDRTAENHQPQQPLTQMPERIENSQQYGRLHDRNILVVDDSVINLRVIQRILTREGASVLIAESGPMALEVLRETRERQGKMDLILMDLQMPGMDGCETTRQIRQHRYFDLTPVVALTAGATTAEKERAESAGMIDFLTKPIDPDVMVQALCSYLST